jgi:hypothetical protein
MRREIIEKIIEILKNDADLNVKYIHFGRPITPIDYPFCVVEPAPAVGRNISRKYLRDAGGGFENVFHVNILVFTRSVKPDEAEKTALDYVEKAYNNVLNNPSLDDLVSNAEPIMIAPEAPLYEGEYAIAVQKLTVEVSWLD